MEARDDLDSERRKDKAACSCSDCAMLWKTEHYVELQEKYYLCPHKEILCDYTFLIGLDNHLFQIQIYC
jgi:hypothetical protein